MQLSESEGSAGFSKELTVLKYFVDFRAASTLLLNVIK